MYILRVQYSCAVVSFFCCGGKVNFVRIFLFNPNFFFFWFWQEIVFGVTYVLSIQYSCAVVSVFLLWRER